MHFTEAGMRPINYYLSSINYYLKYSPWLVRNTLHPHPRGEGSACLVLMSSFNSPATKRCPGLQCGILELLLGRGPPRGLGGTFW